MLLVHVHIYHSFLSIHDVNPFFVSQSTNGYPASICFRCAFSHVFASKTPKWLDVEKLTFLGGSYVH
ncbi:hypothetical protein PMIT1320_00916 [Prochlorococcus marinus str. MIT 1320]|nr:hypothetical protein PMIT1320_00916 [Prochlorococcus marinus str. MIT 1320]